MRVNRVQKARKPQGTCGRCGDELGVGDPYIWIKSRYGPKRTRCTKPGCAFRQSDMTSSDKLATIYSAVESVEDTLAAWGDGSVDDLTEALEQAAEEVRGAGEEYEESASNMEEHFQGSSQVDEIREKAEAAEEFAERLETVRDEIEDLRPVVGEDPTKPCPTCGEEYQKACKEAEKLTVFPPRAATQTLKVRDLKEGMELVDRDVPNAFGPSAPLREVKNLRGPLPHPFSEREDVSNRADYDYEVMGFSPFGNMTTWVPADADVEILPPDIAYRKKGTAKSPRWEWYRGDHVFPVDVPDVENTCLDCDGTGEVHLDDPEEWRDEARSAVEDALAELPL